MPKLNPMPPMQSQLRLVDEVRRLGARSNWLSEDGSQTSHFFQPRWKWQLWPSFFPEREAGKKNLKLSLGELEPVGRHRSPWHSHVPEQIVWYVHPIQTLQPLGCLWSREVKAPNCFGWDFDHAVRTPHWVWYINCPRRRRTFALTFKDFNFSILKVQNNSR